MGANAELVEKTYEAFGRGDIPAVIANLADDVEWSSPTTLPQGGLFHGMSGAMQFFEGLGRRGRRWPSPWRLSATLVRTWSWG
jgi:ketosteroid isomerase-like protein